MNMEMARKVILALSDLGLNCFCLCPGGRSAPFVEWLSKAQGLEVLSFFEEQSAGFFALGRAERDNRPVAVVCTSGTAVAQLLPPAIEAFYSGQALVFVTADRPLNFGQKGTPQTLKRATALLQNYCGASFNVQKPEDVRPWQWGLPKTSLHLNVCFNEPLIDAEFEPLKVSTPLKPQPKPQKEGFLKNKEGERVLKDFFRLCKKPLILAGGLNPQDQRLAEELFRDFKGLFYAEALSGLEALPAHLLSGDKILKEAFSSGSSDGVIRLGAIPKCRFWRDLENQPRVPVLSFAPSPFFPGLARSSYLRPLSELGLLKARLLDLPEYGQALKERDCLQAEKWQTLLKAHKQSEDFWFWRLKQSIKGGAKVFLGNSLPVRLWDNTGFCRRSDLQVAGQSGVNGIDGLLSRFFGSCEPGRDNVGIFGDLSLLYDTPAFWRAKDLPAWGAVVINNFGGRIFSRLFKNPAFLNEHNLSFEPLAKMWSLPYELWEDSESFRWPKKAYNLIEIRPDKKATEALFQEYLALWQKSPVL